MKTKFRLMQGLTALMTLSLFMSVFATVPANAVEKSDRCIAIDRDLTIFVPCAKYGDLLFAFSLTRYEKPDSNGRSELFWRVGSFSIIDAEQISGNFNCVTPLAVSTDFTLTIECADYYGTHIKFSLLPDYSQSGSGNLGSDLLWKLDLASVETVNDGIWQSRGYGRILEINDGKFTLYDYTQASLLPDPEMQGETDGDRFFINGDYFIGTFNNGSFRLEGGSGDYEFVRIDNLPQVTINSSTDDPVSNFEVFWHTFEEQCSLLGTVNVDWHGVYDEYKSKILESTTDEELFALMGQMIRMLHDPHTFIYAPELNMSVSSADQPAFERLLTDNIESYKTAILSWLDQESFNPENNITANGNIAYGIINREYGYLAVNSFVGYSDTGSIVDEKENFSAFIDQAATFFRSQNVKGVILDLRANSGGYDELALTLGKRFTADPIKVYSKQYRDGGYNDFSDSREFMIVPEGVSLADIPISVLTSGMTVSAAEVAVLIFKALPATEIIGETTRGAFSDILDKTLPNGWTLGLSNERYSSYEGENYEQRGISPDIEILMTQEDLDSGRDRFIEAAIYNLDSKVSKFNAIAEAVEKDLEKNYATGASVALWVDGKIIWVGGFGSTGSESNIQINRDTQFMIGSDTKKMTAISLLRKVSAGKIALDSKVADILPDLVMEKAPWFTQATIHDLLSMQGGISDGAEITSDTSDSALYDYAYGTFAKEYTPLAPPSRLWNYSNPNYSIAGLIDQTIDSRAWADIVTEDIFRPLKMARTVARKSEVDKENHCAGFSVSLSDNGTPLQIPLEQTWETAFTRPAGLVWSTPSDQMKLAQFIVDGNPEILDTALLRKLSEKQVCIYPDLPGGYGYGLFVDQGISIDNLWYDIPVWSHGGNTDTHTSTFYILPEQRFAVSILSNGEGDDFSQSLIAAIKAMVTLPPPANPPQPLFDPSELDELTGTYVDSFNLGELIVGRNGDALTISLPALDREGIEYERIMEPLSTRVWIATIDGMALDVTFVDGTDGEIYVRNRLAVFIRWPEGKSWQTVRRPSKEQLIKTLDAMRHIRNLSRCSNSMLYPREGK